MFLVPDFGSEKTYYLVYVQFAGGRGGVKTDYLLYPQLSLVQKIEKIKLRHFQPALIKIDVEVRVQQKGLGLRVEGKRYNRNCLTTFLGHPVPLTRLLYQGDI